MGLQAQTVLVPTKSGEMQCELREPEGGAKRGGVIVVPEAYGVTSGVIADCQRLAAAGYTALGIEIYHRTAPAGWVSKTFDFQEAGPHFKALTNETLAVDLDAARAFLGAHPSSNGKIGVVGFCVGGFAAYLGACRCQLAASAVFYGGGIVHERAHLTGLKPLLSEKPTCPVLGCFGGADSSIPDPDVKAIEAALTAQGVPHQLIVYPGAGHAFGNPERASYHAEASAMAWDATLEFLAKQLT